MVHLGTQLWERDWFEYKRPGIRVSTWSETLDYGFTSARVGEYLESTARANSGRGLYHRVSGSGLRFDISRSVPSGRTCNILTMTYT